MKTDAFQRSSEAHVRLLSIKDDAPRPVSQFQSIVIELADLNQWRTETVVGFAWKPFDRTVGAVAGVLGAVTTASNRNNKAPINYSPDSPRQVDCYCSGDEG